MTVQPLTDVFQLDFLEYDPELDKEKENFNDHLN